MGDSDALIRLDAATVLLQWATGGLLFLWVTSRRRLLGIGYGWLLRTVYAVIAVGAVVAGQLTEPVPVRDVARRPGGGGRHRRPGRVDRPAQGGCLRPTGPEGTAGGPGGGHARRTDGTAAGRRPTPTLPPPRHRWQHRPKEFPPVLDLIAPAIGVVGLVAAAVDAGGPTVLALVRILAGAAFLGAVSDAMLLGHWYLVQPGLGRQPLLELNRWLAITWPIEVGALLWPTGMLSVLSGSIDDGWNGTLGWFWVACALTTLVLTFVTSKALEEKSYSAVMAATGLLYLAILMAFGTDLVARAVLAG